MLDPAVKELAQGPNHAVVTTVMPDGTLQSTVTWVDADDDHVLVNCEMIRQRVRNVEKDPRVNVMIIPDGNWWNVVEVRGRVVEIRRGPEAREHIDHVSRIYTGGAYSEPIESERVMLVIEPDRQRVV